MPEPRRAPWLEQARRSFQSPMTPLHQIERKAAELYRDSLRRAGEIQDE
jgi:hypothetical protein